jgi:hypothetical protein
MQFLNGGARQPGPSTRMCADQPDHARWSAEPDEFVHPRAAITRPGRPGMSHLDLLCAQLFWRTHCAHRRRRCASGRSSSRRQTRARPDPVQGAAYTHCPTLGGPGDGAHLSYADLNRADSRARVAGHTIYFSSKIRSSMGRVLDGVQPGVWVASGQDEELVGGWSRKAWKPAIESSPRCK